MATNVTLHILRRVCRQFFAFLLNVFLEDKIRPRGVILDASPEDISVGRTIIEVANQSGRGRIVAELAEHRANRESGGIASIQADLLG